MVMGPHAQAIYDQSVYPLVQEIHREELKNQRLGIAERWQEFYSLASATLIFAVLSFFGALMARYSGLQELRFLVLWKDGHISKVSISA